VQLARAAAMNWSGVRNVPGRRTPRSLTSIALAASASETLQLGKFAELASRPPTTIFAISAAMAARWLVVRWRDRPRASLRRLTGPINGAPAGGLKSAPRRLVSSGGGGIVVLGRRSRALFCWIGLVTWRPRATLGGGAARTARRVRVA
jgi:hypothetical protein